jgi:hypothetical protein
MMMGTDAWTVSTVGVPHQLSCLFYLPTTSQEKGGVLTFRGHHADHNGRGCAGALHKDCDQHTNDQSSHRVGQYHVVLEDVSSHFACAQDRGALKLQKAAAHLHPGCPSAHLLPRSWKAELRISREQMKK